MATAARVYRRLLVLYPTNYRQEYGPRMEHLFRDQCRDAREQAGWPALFGLFGQTAWDLAKSAMVEHIREAQRKLSMNPAATVRLCAAPTGTAVFLAIMATVVTATLMVPRTYMSYTRIRVEKEGPGVRTVGEFTPAEPADRSFLQTELEMLRSTLVLHRVVNELGLTERWSGRTEPTAISGPEQAVGLLRQMLEIHHYRNTSFIEIRVFSEDREEAASIANHLARIYRQTAVRDTPQKRVIVTDLAEPGLRPVRPNVPRNVVLGGLLAVVGGLLSAAAIRLFHAFRDPPTADHAPRST